jgi:hypothetical protein
VLLWRFSKHYRRRDRWLSALLPARPPLSGIVLDVAV